MPRRLLPIVPLVLGLAFPAAPVKAADPEIDRLLQSPVGKDWVTNGGNMTNQRYSTLKQIDTTNVKQLKGDLAAPPLPHQRAYGSRTTAVRLG